MGLLEVRSRAPRPSVTDYYEYDAWGNVLPGSFGSTPFKWNAAGGYQHIPFTGLYHVGAREYDPRTARWLQRDPIGQSSGDPNLYRYCGNDAVNLNDPSGLEPRLILIHIDSRRQSQAVGTHLRIYIETDGQNRIGTWYGFYLNRGSSSSKRPSSSGGTSGRGVVRLLDDPSSKQWENGEVIGILVDSADAEKILAKIEAFSKSPKGYDLQTYNCATWGQEMLSAGGLTKYDPANPVKTPRQLIESLKNDVSGIHVIEDASQLLLRGIGKDAVKSHAPRPKVGREQ